MDYCNLAESLITLVTIFRTKTEENSIYYTHYSSFAKFRGKPHNIKPTLSEILKGIWINAFLKKKLAGYWAHCKPFLQFHSLSDEDEAQ